VFNQTLTIGLVNYQHLCSFLLICEFEYSFHFSSLKFDTFSWQYNNILYLHKQVLHKFTFKRINLKRSFKEFVPLSFCCCFEGDFSVKAFVVIIFLLQWVSFVNKHLFILLSTSNDTTFCLIISKRFDYPINIMISR